MTPDHNKALARQHDAALLDAFPAVLVLAEDDLVTIVHHELRGDGDDELDFFGFRTHRIAAGRIVATWSNEAPGTAPFGTGRRAAGRVEAPIGPGEPDTNKRRVADFYRCVFDAHDPAAVRDFVTEDYHQHARHQPTGRAGLESLVRAAFPDGPVPTPETADIPPAILMGEGDLVVIAGALPQPDGGGGTFTRLLYDAFRVRDGMLVEHWSGVDPRNPPTM